MALYVLLVAEKGKVVAEAGHPPMVRTRAPSLLLTGAHHANRTSWMNPNRQQCNAGTMFVRFCIIIGLRWVKVAPLVPPTNEQNVNCIFSAQNRVPNRRWSMIQTCYHVLRVWMVVLSVSPLEHSIFHNSQKITPFVRCCWCSHHWIGASARCFRTASF